MPNPNHKKSKKRIALLATGGTIAGIGGAGKSSGYKAGQLPVSKLIESIPGIEAIADVYCEQVANVDSGSMNEKIWIKLASRINELSKDDSIDGFVITHGTDTLEETAYFLNLTSRTQKPVVVTGAMRPMTAFSPDGPFNLYQSVALAASDKAQGMGVLICFAEGIYGARDVSKINTFMVDAFGNNNFGCLGYMREVTPLFYFQSLKKHTASSDFDVSAIKRFPNVQIVHFSVQANAAVLDYYANTADAIVLAGAGDGGISDEWKHKIKSITASGKAAVRSTRVVNGVVARNAGMKDDELGTIAADTLNPEKARILLMLALTITNDPKRIQEIFLEY